MSDIASNFYGDGASSTAPTSKPHQILTGERAMELDSFAAGRALDRTRVALTSAFGPDLFGMPPFAAKRNQGYPIRDAIECAKIRLY